MAIIRNCKIAEACFAPFVDEIPEHGRRASLPWTPARVPRLP